jgi:hypothetical protein
MDASNRAVNPGNPGRLSSALGSRVDAPSFVSPVVSCLSVHRPSPSHDVSHRSPPVGPLFPRDRCHCTSSGSPDISSGLETLASTDHRTGSHDPEMIGLFPSSSHPHLDSSQYFTS